jgi:uncharacterized protein (TIGR03067 family)
MKREILAALLVSTAALLTPVAVTFAAESEEGFTSIFNGKDLTGWDGNPELWSAKDGAIVGQTSADKPIKGNTFLIWKDGTTADFELRLSYRITPLAGKGFANSGIQYRSKVLDAAGWRVGGYQADFEAGLNYSGILYDEGGVAGGRNIMAARGEKVVWDKDCKKQVTGSVGKSEEIQTAIKKEDWNDYVILAQGNHLQHFINGRLTVDVTDECEAKALKSGVLALQVHAGDPMKVEFRNLRLKTLTAGSTSAADDLQKLQGKWEVAGGEVNGSAIPESDIPTITLTITDKSYLVERDGSTDRGSFSVDPSKQPKQMDIQPGSGDDAGNQLLAIYELGVDSFKVCYAAAGEDRPKSFATEPDSRRLTINYKRKK